MDDLPRFRLFDGPSPFHALPRLSAALGHDVEVWVKREDLLPLAFGGNKLRNLEFLVGAALAEAADTLITSGRRWSNHARLTAAAGAKAGLAVDLVLSGPPAIEPGPGIRLATTLGATIHQLSTADRAARDAEVDRVAAAARAMGRRPYVIGVGGSGAMGAWAQVLAGREAFAQAAAADVVIDRIVLPSATGGTQAGLIVAAAEVSPSPRVHGVLVARPADELRPSIMAMVAALDPESADREAELDETQLGEGYGRRTPAADAATELLARTEGLLVDPIYTAKALAGLVAGVRSGAWDGERIVFWHAGGLPGLFEPLD
ncbi:MAG: 1-aminocyclopropane-1-carboxylate deaminase/D-cysteine desulfhydrase [Candidatus Limnocylindrales bacterium]